MYFCPGVGADQGKVVWKIDGCPYWKSFLFTTLKLSMEEQCENLVLVFPHIKENAELSKLFQFQVFYS